MLFHLEFAAYDRLKIIHNSLHSLSPFLSINFINLYFLGLEVTFVNLLVCFARTFLYDFRLRSLKLSYPLLEELLLNYVHAKLFLNSIACYGCNYDLMDCDLFCLHLLLFLLIRFCWILNYENHLVACLDF